MDSTTKDLKPAATALATNGNAARRKTALGWVAGVALVAGAGYAGWLYLGAPQEHTDNAYVQANVVQITPQVGGTVVAVAADDTDFVKAGQPLVRLDESDAKVALEQAEAQLAQAVREVRGLYANNSTLKAQIELRQAELARLQADQARAQDDVERRRPLVATGAVGKEEFNHATAQVTAARSATAAAQSAVLAAREQLASNQTLTDGTAVEQHPNVQRAAARVHEAYLALKRTSLPAPVDGYVARRSVQVGQRVQAGAPLMAVVALGEVWVDANFKEGQLQRLRIGQPATLVADVYGKKVEYHGQVAGLGAGTGAAFSLLPAQNATGNWIKVVQRVPVRITLDAKDVAAHPLRVGLSMDAVVDVSKQDGKMLADAPSTRAATQTAVFDSVQTEANADVQRIIAANLGHGARAAGTVAHKASGRQRQAAQPAPGEPGDTSEPPATLASAARRARAAATAH